LEPMSNSSFLEREKRLSEAIALKKPDRVPVAPLIVHYYPTRAAGISNKDAMLDYEKRYESLKEMTLKLDLDVSISPLGFPPARFLDNLGLTGFKWPGGSLRDHQPFQFSCDGTLRPSEYTEFLSDPNGFTLRKIWPQISTTLAPLAQLPLPPLFWLSHPYDLAFILPELVASPSVLSILKQLVALGEEFASFSGATNKYLIEMRELGYPLAFGGVALTAFDCVGDFLRGMRGAMTDMYRAPEKLLETIEMLTPASIQKGIVSARNTGCSRVFIPLHWGGGAMMSNDQYARFYWPCLKTLLLGLLDAGLTPVPLFEGNYTPRLEFLKELPKGKVAGHFEVVDRRKAKEVLGDTMCFWGNVSASLMTTGSAAEVREDVKELIEIFGDNGGLIIDASVGLPDETKPENLAAMVEAVKEFGGF
jgi:uroporphyrinogen-III decarboxylase